MAVTNYFFRFCQYVDETIFSDENRGSVVAFVVDQTFIDDFCKKFQTTEKMLLFDTRLYLGRINNDPFLIKGLIAIQVFAATKRANSDGITEANYRDRLSDLIFEDTNELQSWMSNYQDTYWSIFYRWCDKNNFLISKKCKPFYGTGRYVQYPLQEALRVFTAEALLNFARAFVENKLTPEDDFSYKTFWEIVSWPSLASYLDTSNARRIYFDPTLKEDAKNQIYNYFLRWDGEYRLKNNSSRRDKVTSSGNHLYLSADMKVFDIRDSDDRLLSSYPVTTAQYRILTNPKNHIPTRRSGIFIFREDPYYGIWKEVRFLEEDEEGIAIIFPSDSTMSFAFKDRPVLFSTSKLRAYKISLKTGPSIYFTEKRTCYLEGGLKAGSDKFILGAAPYLVNEENITVRIDHKVLDDHSSRVSLNYLSEGSHIITIPGKKSIHFELVNPIIQPPEWNSKNKTWELGKNNNIWRTSKESDGISGMDFSCSCRHINEDQTPPLQAWSLLYLGRRSDSNNITIKTLKHIVDHD